MTDKEDERSSSKGADKSAEQIYNQFKQLIDKKPKRVALFTHATPDPDAMGSIMGMDWLFQKVCGSECSGFYDGAISHPQNKTMRNLLAPNIFPIADYKPEDFDLNVVVDTVPVNAGVGNNKINFDLVIDHHREIPNGGFNGLFVNLKAGSCCGTIYTLLKYYGLKFEDDNDNDSRVATGIMVGISTDTEALMSDDTTNYEFEAWSDLFPLRNQDFFKKILNWEKPKFWIDKEAEAVAKYSVINNVGVVGLGIIPIGQRDLIPYIADQMIGWEDVSTSVAFAVVEGDRIEGSVRSRNPATMVPDLCKILAGRHGNGGGKLGKGAYSYQLAGSSIEEEDDDETKIKTWNLFNEKETKRIRRLLQK